MTTNPRLVRRSADACAWLPLLIVMAAATSGFAQESTGSQPVPGTTLTLDETLRLAEARSEQIAIGQYGVAKATAEQRRARSERQPQVAASASYDRTLKSEFSGVFSGSAGPVCDPFLLDASRTLDARVAELERAIDCGAVGGGGFGGSDFSDLPFGQANTYRFSLSFSQALYTGGRLTAQDQSAALGRVFAELSLESARAQIVLDATQAFYDAALAERLVAIAEAGVEQASATLAQVELSHKAGRVAEFDLLRARVARDNQRPGVIRAKAARTLAYLRLKQLLEIPASQNVSVSVDLDDPVLAAPDRFAPVLASVSAAPAAGTALARVPVRQAASSVALREASQRIVRSQRRPSVFATSALGKVAYSGIPGLDDWRTNWTVGAVMQVPLFTGGRIKAEETVAAAALDEARAQQRLIVELAESETESALALLDAARATWESSAGTVEQAARAYEIAAIRYREGISTQLELLDARLVLQQAQVTRAQAARDLQVSRARVALLPQLPLAGANAGTSGGF